MITRQELAQNKALARDRACGCMTGLAIGDSLGDAARKDENRIQFGMTTDFTDAATWSTDDTEFALLTAQMLLEGGGELTSDAVVDAWFRVVAIKDELKRGGHSEVAAAANLHRGLRPPQSGQFNSNHLSDGSAMRISPVGIVWAGDPERAARVAQVDASISHSEDGLWGAQAIAAAVAVAMVGATLDEIIDVAMHYLPQTSWTYYNMRELMALLQKNNNDLYACWMPMHEMLRCRDMASTSEALPATFACLKMAKGSFRDAVIIASNYGRDADTIGALCGTIMGAQIGMSAISPRWVEKTRYTTGICLQFTKGMDVVKVGEQLAELIRA